MDEENIVTKSQSKASRRGEGEPPPRRRAASLSEEKNKDLENKVAELREALEKEIGQQQNAGVLRDTGNARNVIEQCEIVKQPLTPAKRFTRNTGYGE